MKDETDATDAPESDQPSDTSRRRFLGGVAVLGVGATLAGCGNASDQPGKPAEHPLTPAKLDKALRDQVKTVVVIYAENRSFNNLVGDFPGVEKPLSALKPADYQQRDRDGSLLQTLPPVWGAWPACAARPAMCPAAWPCSTTASRSAPRRSRPSPCHPARRSRCAGSWSAASR